MNVGILSVGTYLPPEIRTNDWWPGTTTSRWLAKRHVGAPKVGPASAGAQAVEAALARYANDPFGGCTQRRVASPDEPAWSLERKAAQDAMQKAGLRADQIDLLLVHSAVPENVVSGDAAKVHEQLGLRRDCFSLSIDAACNSFLQQLLLANRWLRNSGKYALLVQSSTLTRACSPEDPVSPLFGDGATAVVLGRVDAGLGVLGDATLTDGSMYNGLVIAGAKGQPWYKGGDLRTQIANYDATMALLWATPAVAKELAEQALESSGLSGGSVGFYASHQGTAWFREVTQSFCGLEGAKSVDTFSWAGGLMGCNIPLVLATAEKERLLNRRDVVLMHAGGSGMTATTVVLRWSQ